jgi:hypothetical protein
MNQPYNLNEQYGRMGDVQTYIRLGLYSLDTKTDYWYWLYGQNYAQVISKDPNMPTSVILNATGGYANNNGSIGRYLVVFDNTTRQSGLTREGTAVPLMFYIDGYGSMYVPGAVAPNNEPPNVLYPGVNGLIDNRSDGPLVGFNTSVMGNSIPLLGATPSINLLSKVTYAIGTAIKPGGPPQVTPVPIRIVRGPSDIVVPIDKKRLPIDINIPYDPLRQFHKVGEPQTFARVKLSSGDSRRYWYWCYNQNYAQLISNSTIVLLNGTGGNANGNSTVGRYILIFDNNKKESVPLPLMIYIDTYGSINVPPEISPSGPSGLINSVSDGNLVGFNTLVMGNSLGLVPNNNPSVAPVYKIALVTVNGPNGPQITIS